MGCRSGTLARLDDGDTLAALVRPGASLAEACLAATASCPGITKVLLSTGDARHWQSALNALDQPPVPVDTLRSVLDVLATP